MYRVAVVCAAVALAACFTDVNVGTTKSCKEELSSRPCNDTSAPPAVDWGSCGSDGVCTCIPGAVLGTNGRCHPAPAASCDASICLNPSPSCTPGRDQECNEDLAMSALAGDCGPDGRCTCGAGFETGPDGRCRPQGSLCRADAGGLPTFADGGAPAAAGSCEGVSCAFAGACSADDAGLVSCTPAAPVAGCFPAPSCGVVECGAGCRCLDADAGACTCPPPDRCAPGMDSTCNDEVMAGTAGRCSRPDGGQAVCTCDDGFALNPATSLCRQAFVSQPLESGPVGSLAVAAAPAQGKVGVAYLVANALDAGFEVRYREVTASGVGASQPVDTVALDFGVALAFDSAGEPKVAYLGGGNDGSLFWPNSDAVMASRVGGNFVRQVVATQGNQTVCGNPVSDRGFLVGVHPALGVEGATTYFSWRDVHDGQFPQQDFAAADVEAAVATGSGATFECVKAGGNDKGAWGAHGRMAMAGGQPALVFDALPGAVSGTGQNVSFTRRSAAGTWSALRTFTAGQVEGGPSLAYDATTGFVVAWQDGPSVVAVSSADGTTWGTPAPVATGLPGTGPDVAMHPTTRLPSLAVETAGGLRVFTAAPGLAGWTGQTVTVDTGLRPKLAYLPDGKRVLAWVDATGALRLSVER